MSKYSGIKTLKETKARKSHKCEYCGGIIESGDIYYLEKIEDEFLHSLHGEKFCSKCHQEYEKKLLKMKTEQNKKDKISNDQKSLENFAD